MRVIIELFGRAFVVQAFQGKVADTDDELETRGEFEHVPVDPHSVGGGFIEHAEPVSASIHATDPIARKFGFHGCQDDS